MHMPKIFILQVNKPLQKNVLIQHISTQYSLCAMHGAGTTAPKEKRAEPLLAR